MGIGTCNLQYSEPVSQKPYPIMVKHYKWVKDKINKLLAANLIICIEIKHLRISNYLYHGRPSKADAQL